MRTLEIFVASVGHKNNMFFFLECAGQLRIIILKKNEGPK
jgi:hypothetical protein